MGLKDLLDDGIGKKIADGIGDKVDEAAIKEMVEKLKDKVDEEELVEKLMSKFNLDKAKALSFLKK
ncbi:MAG: hypothetical protein E7259_08395 [Lachnospiraceae bacterium]|nr:hypothetical protein [Lachnospiraceae bacterium]